MFRHYAGLLLGVLACSTSALWIKASSTHPFVLCALRLGLGAIFLAPLAWRDARIHAGAFHRGHLRRTLAPAAVLAAHFITWTYAARLTLAAQASLIVNLVPVAVPFFLLGLANETVNRREILGTIVVVAGVLLLGGREGFAGGGDAWGNAVCVVSMLLFAWYLALGRRNRNFPSLWLYVVPVYAEASVICLLVSLPWLSTFAWTSLREWLLMLALALLPTIIGHSLLNNSMRHLRGQTVSLANVGQFVFAGVLAWFWFGESPPPIFYLASAVVIAGVAVVVFAAPPPPRLR